MSLDPKFQFGALDLAAPPFAIAYGSDFGSPEAVVASVQSALRDGSLTKVTKYDNRTVEIPVLIEGATQLELADAEALLVAEAMKERNEFTFNPGDGTAPDSVFDTYTANLVPDRDDDREIGLMRLYTLTFDAHPWPHSANKIITPAVTTAAPTVVDSGSSTTNWTAPFPAGAALSVVSGAIRVTYDPSIPDWNVYYCTAVARRTATINTSVNKYIAVDWKSSRGVFYWLGTPPQSGGTYPGGEPLKLPEVRREPAPVAGFTRSWFKVADDVTSLPWIQFAVWHPVDAVSGTATLDIDQVLQANALPASGTTRQKVATIFPGGSVPAEGTVLVQHPTAGLGHTVVFSHSLEGGYSPPLMQWKVAGAGRSADATLVSGAYNALSPTCGFAVPVSAIPSGDTGLWALLQRSSIGTVRLSWAAYSTVGGFLSPLGNSITGFVDVPFAAAGTWYLVQLARFTSPPTKIGPAGFLRVDIAGDASTIIDEAFLFAMDRGTLTVVNNGTGTGALGAAANRLRVSAPSLDTPNGEILAGYSADWSDAHTALSSLVACDQVTHRFDPDGSMIFTVTSGATDAAVSLEHYPRWHTHAGNV